MRFPKVDGFSHELPPFASSYAHLPGVVGEIWTAVKERFESLFERSWLHVWDFIKV